MILATAWRAMRRGCAVGACGAALLLVACATPAPTASLDGAPYWNGRLALTVDSDPPQSFSAGFDLRGTPQTGELQLNSPLGTALATVRWTPEGAELLQGDKITRRPTLDTLTTELGGHALPVAALFAWLRGHGASVNGWQADLSRQASGRIVARRTQPLPTAELRIVFQP
ncbi:lipoprotein insertase outer membrane protein LolB [Hydrogenophaga sp. SL48]|uniref:lipoprotein insertase outer membrane protein LolB n=1 Tax=Hydrogenophaga sp. SL48 TaxID=2806347 RepID=UPI001F44E967|nr:lipoprotein insertase outer membrane protein LolB [Hydrogenophaga sp. SL48]UJW79121.1 outer membrane lipoprotein LolB [Hydrogenophaga sp. SL48]